jgi:hypothetical protein
VVVFAAGSLAEDVVRGVARRRKDWSSRLKTNRLRETARVQLRDAHGWALPLPGPHSAVEERVPLIPAPASRPVTVRAPPYWGFTRAVRLSGLGQVRIVVRVEPASVTGRDVVLLTNRVDWTAATIIGLSWQRWPTDTFSQDSTGPLGCNAYRRRSAEALGTHGCLVFVASALWPLTGRPAGPDRPTSRIHTMGDACRQQGRALLQQLLCCVHDQLSHGATADHGVAQLCAKQRGLVLV